MAPKKKNNRRGQEEDWEAELGESIPTSTENETPETPVDTPPAEEQPNTPAAGDDAPAGGLMGLMKRNKGKWKKKDATAEADEAAKDQPAVEEVDYSIKEEPQEANAEDEFDWPTNKKGKGKGGKGKQQQEPKQSPKAAAAAAGDDEAPRVLTKAEKEKLKKEREKQKKKEAAAQKKASAPTPPVKETKAQPTKADSPAEPAPAASAPAKKKKIPAALAALQKQQEELRRKEAEKQRLLEEEKARIAELEQQEAEEEKRREEQRAIKKQREKEKIEQLKKEGKYMTKAQKEEKARNERKLKQMLDAGVKVGALERGGAAAPTTEKKKLEIRKKPAKADEEKLLLEAAERARVKAEKEIAEREAREKAEAEKAAALRAQEKEDVEDDWEAAVSDDDTKDNWDDDSDAEETKKTEEDEGKRSDSESEEENAAAAAAAVQSRAAQDAKAEAQRRKEAAERRERAHQEALAAASKDNLRSPICCILGHVDTGKTKLLDKIRQTNVQEGEAGGITQQIGATYFPVEAIRQKTAVVNKDKAIDFKVPGLLIIDTPGHESFSNLRSRGSSLCNIAILVVDITHGLEQQTLESMKLLRDRKTPFIVALNKVDRLYGWKKIDNNGFQESLAKQSRSVQNEYKSRLEATKLAFAEQGFNAEAYYENKNMSRFVSLVPTSALTGEGIPDMLKLILKLTQERMVGSLMYLSEVEATVLEVKAIEGFGMTIDVVLTNGILREGDRIVVCGVEGPIVTNIRALLTPQPLRELRIKSQYVHNKEVKAALGVKISAPGLEGAVAGSRLLVVGPEDNEEDLAEEVMGDLANLLSRIETTGRGVSVQASTLGSLEALLDFLKDMKIPVANVGIGPVYKRDIMQASIMLEKAPDYAVMLCFDVKVDKDATQYAEDNGIKIFTADIIYHLFDAFTKHMEERLAKKREENKLLAVYPCVLRTVAVFNKSKPIIIGVDVAEGQLKLGTPLAVVKKVGDKKEIIQIGRVSSIERDHKQIPVCKKGQPSVAIKIDFGDKQPSYDRQLEESDQIYSYLTRASIDCLKEFYRKEVTTEEWLLIKKMKPLLNIA